jgi:uncharacterized BrkB/YihY/UPF0761 family membrane protein
VSKIDTTSLLVAGIILVIVGIIVVAIPFNAWTEHTVEERMPDIFGWVIFIIGIIFVIIWAIKRAM